ncbi:hypothetical protein PY650_15930 [Rhizobium calliandrae]|uniref:MarR family transcriptional regulator n=1 Tax=Rhizobium calliandrae TaxID=1312182 RepID=A0ABT7KF86_9HYPH|nr:hypothetical protein [Rhizobium calliandrae]MDL2407126.1 hypothetical protein [Rhizobium calliandrae]
MLTDKGQLAYDAAIKAYNPRVNAMTKGLSLEDIQTAHRVMAALRERLDGELDAEKHD